MAHVADWSFGVPNASTFFLATQAGLFLWARSDEAYSRNFSSYQWSMSDASLLHARCIPDIVSPPVPLLKEYHLRPVHKILARAGLRLDKFEP